MSRVDEVPEGAVSVKTVGLRTSCFAAVVMILFEYGLGAAVNLYATLPATDHGKGVFAGFGGAVVHGPVVLSLHALFGTLILVTGIAAVIRASLLRRAPFITLTGIALLALLVAWLSGSMFVGDMNNAASLTMALATGVALLGYATILFIVPSAAIPLVVPND